MGWERDERDEKVENFERGTKPENYLVTLESGVPEKTFDDEYQDKREGGFQETYFENKRCDLENVDFVRMVSAFLGCWIGRCTS